MISKCLLLRSDGLVAAGAAGWRDHRHRAARRGRLLDLRVDTFWRADHAAGARELVAQVFLAILALRFNFAALPDRGLRVRFRAFRIYLLSLGRDRRFRCGRSLSHCHRRQQQRRGPSQQKMRISHTLARSLYSARAYTRRSRITAQRQ